MIEQAATRQKPDGSQLLGRDSGWPASGGSQAERGEHRARQKARSEQSGTIYAIHINQYRCTYYTCIYTQQYRAKISQEPARQCCCVLIWCGSVLRCAAVLFSLALSVSFRFTACITYCTVEYTRMDRGLPLSLTRVVVGWSTREPEGITEWSHTVEPPGCKAEKQQRAGCGENFKGCCIRWYYTCIYCIYTVNALLFVHIHLMTK